MKPDTTVNTSKGWTHSLASQTKNVKKGTRHLQNIRNSEEGLIEYYKFRPTFPFQVWEFEFWREVYPLDGAFHDVQQNRPADDFRLLRLPTHPRLLRLDADGLHGVTCQV